MISSIAFSVTGILSLVVGGSIAFLGVELLRRKVSGFSLQDRTVLTAAYTVLLAYLLAQLGFAFGGVN